VTALDAPVGVEGVLAQFASAGALLASDVRTALTLGRLAGETDEQVLLAAALTVRGLRLGSVCVDLAEVRGSVVPEPLLDPHAPPPPSALGNDHVRHGHAHLARPIDRAEPATASQGTAEPGLDGLAWPDPTAWVQACGASSMVSLEPPPPIWRRQPRTDARPLHLQGSLLYLDRYAQLEQLVRSVLQRRARRAPPAVDPALLREVLDEVLPPGPNDQRLAAAAAVTGWVTVIAGGPGTGKTTTVGSLLAVLSGLADRTGEAPPRVALAAPTGKAAARLTEQLGGAPVAQTIHRLLGSRPWQGTRFEHSWQTRLPYDVVVVDETSMVSLELMARLLESLPPTCRVVLVGDPDQLSSVDAGAVLGDLVERPARRSSDRREQLLAAVVPDDLAGHQQTPAPTVQAELRRDLVRLRHNRRAERAIARLGDAIRSGDADAVVAALTSDATEQGVVEWLDLDPAHAGPVELGSVRHDVVQSGVAMVHAARRGDAAGALQALGEHRLLCAHRVGSYGVSDWRLRAERWISEGLGRGAASPWGSDEDAFAVGRALLVAENDRAVGLWNGDTGVVVAAEPGVLAVVDRGGGVTLQVPVHRLPAVQSPLAMTVHKAQGSEADRVTVVLPPPQSPLLTRELLYTAVTRARHLVRVVGTEPAVRAAVERRVTRASGLRHGWD
jgi:exodeoxyribonuclease V alpha subunit